MRCWCKASIQNLMHDLLTRCTTSWLIRAAYNGKDSRQGGLSSSLGEALSGAEERIEETAAVISRQPLPAVRPIQVWRAFLCFAPVRNRDHTAVLIGSGLTRPVTRFTNPPL